MTAGERNEAEVYGKPRSEILLQMYTRVSGLYAFLGLLGSTKAGGEASLVGIFIQAVSLQEKIFSQ